MNNQNQKKQLNPNNDSHTDSHKERMKEIEKKYDSFEPKKFFGDFSEPKPKKEEISRLLYNRFGTN